jgi:hypothetical protein
MLSNYCYLVGKSRVMALIRNPLNNPLMSDIAIYQQLNMKNRPN